MSIEESSIPHEVEYDGSQMLKMQQASALLQVSTRELIELMTTNSTEEGGEI